MKRPSITWEYVLFVLLIGIITLVVFGKVTTWYKKNSRTAKDESVDDRIEEKSIPRTGKSLGEFAIKGPQSFKTSPHFSQKQEKNGEALIETPVKEETKITARKEEPAILVNRKKDYIPEELTKRKVISKRLTITTFTINVASLKEKENADRYVDELKEKNLKAFVWEVNLPNNKRWYRVSVGHFPSRLKAENYREKRIQKGFSNLWISQIPQ